MCDGCALLQRGRLHAHHHHDIGGVCLSSDQLVDDAVLQLVDEAHHRWLVEEEGVVDDITAVVVMFTHAA